MMGTVQIKQNIRLCHEINDHTSLSSNLKLYITFPFTQTYTATFCMFKAWKIEYRNYLIFLYLLVSSYSQFQHLLWKHEKILNQFRHTKISPSYRYDPNAPNVNTAIKVCNSLPQTIKGLYLYTKVIMPALMGIYFLTTSMMYINLPQMNILNCLTACNREKKLSFCCNNLTK